MTKWIHLSEAERARAAAQIDKHFDITEYLLEHPEILEALPDGIVLDSESIEGIWLRLPSAVQNASGHEVIGDLPVSRTTISGTEIHGSQGTSSATSGGQVER